LAHPVVQAEALAAAWTRATLSPRATSRCFIITGNHFYP
jgi:hypothetical protein